MSNGDEKYSAEQFMYLNSANVENCDFFKKDVSYSIKKLNNCLSHK